MERRGDRAAVGAVLHVDPPAAVPARREAPHGLLLPRPKHPAGAARLPLLLPQRRKGNFVRYSSL